ncbi:MAG: glycosyltransferase [Acetobacteraceae bacterium]|nr:glycosyltransferase [Acetobacteraceae bacterium]
MTRNILHIMQTTNLAGTEHAALAVMQELQNAGAKFSIVSPRSRGLVWPKLTAIDPCAQAFPCRDSGLLGKFDPAAFQRFKSHVQSLAEHSDAIWISGSSVTSLLASHSTTRPKVLSHHVLHFDGRWSSIKWKAFYQLLCRDLDAVTFPTELVRSEALRIAPWLRSRAHVAPLGYRLGYAHEQQRKALQVEARRLLDLPQDTLIVGNGGRMITAKRFDIFLDTAAFVLAQDPEAFFVICGSGPVEQEMRQRAARLGIASRVRFTGWVADLRPHYQAWDLILFNSDCDTLPRAPMEAASHGTIIVASLLYGGLGEFVLHGRNGYLLDRHDPAELARLILQVSRDPSLAMQLRETARSDLTNHYSVEAGVAFYKRFFDL